MLSGADCVTPAEVAEILALCTLVTLVVVTVKPALMRPAGTVTCAGTLASALLLCSVTVVPPEGAAAVRFTVQDALDPPVTLAGVHTTEETPG